MYVFVRVIGVDGEPFQFEAFDNTTDLVNFLNNDVVMYYEPDQTLLNLTLEESKLPKNLIKVEHNGECEIDKNIFKFSFLEKIHNNFVENFSDEWNFRFPYQFRTTTLDANRYSTKLKFK